MFEFTDVGRHRLESFLEDLGMLLGNRPRRASFAAYALGLLSEGERKSVEPIAARASGGTESVDAVHQRLLHFLTDSDWSDMKIRAAAAEYALAQMTRTEPVEAWIIDDTGFLKQGNHSVGVHRQYTGSAGKITNCQVGVSLVLATREDHLPVDFELYLPESWANDPVRRREARIPEDVTFKTKLELALSMVARATESGLPPGVVLADAAYGTSSEFRHELRRRGLHYSVGVDPQTTVYEVGTAVMPGGHATSVRELADALQAKGRLLEHTWRQGTGSELTASFAMQRVYPCREKAHPEREREAVWLLIEWRKGGTKPSNYFLSSLPEETSFEELVRITMQRWRTERAYQDMKGELGLDHYEGRRYRGWHHHISVVLACYAFAVAERHRFFPLRSKALGDTSTSDVRRRRPDARMLTAGERDRRAGASPSRSQGRPRSHLGET
jgi:SRSO17 transposase